MRFANSFKRVDEYISVSSFAGDRIELSHDFCMSYYVDFALFDTTGTRWEV